MKKIAALLALALASVALVACGGDDNGTTTTQPSGGAASGGKEATGGAAGGKTTGGAAAGKPSGGAETIKLEADPDGQLAYTTDTLNARPGNLTIDFSNPASITHDVAVQDSGGNSLGVSDLIAQSSTTLVLKNLRPGSYTFYCTVPGHKEAGMEGTLTVK